MDKGIWSWIRILLAFVFAAVPLDRSIRVGAAGLQTKANRQDAPIALWSITWTTTANYFYDGYHYDWSPVQIFHFTRDVTQTGSTIVRQYADGSWDNTAFTWHVTDDQDNTHDLGYSGLWFDDHETWTIIDPDRYTGTLAHVLNVIPEQLPGGAWRANIAWSDLLSNMFTSAHDITYKHGGQTDTSHTESGEWLPDCGATHPGLSLPATLDGNAEGNDFNYHDEFNGPSGIDNCLQGAQTASLSVDVTVHRLIGMDLTVKHLEVTQGLQDGANSIPFVQGRSTVVRAFIDLGLSTEPIANVTGELTGYAGATLLGTVEPFNLNETITAPVDPDWMKINDTLNFELPLAWTLQPSLTLTVKVNPNHRVAEESYDNNELSADVSTRACNPISIGYTPIHYAPPGVAAADPSANIKKAQEFMQKIYPVADNGIVYKRRGALTLLQDINTANNNNNLLESLEDLLNISNGPHPDHLFGWLPSLAYDHNGRAWNPGVAAFGNDTEASANDRWRRTFAHEIGHNLGLDDANPDYLYTDGDHWFDVYDRVIKPMPGTVTGGEGLYDVMVPGKLESQAWISPTNYMKLVAALCPAVPAAASSGSSPAQASDNVIISGSINNTTPITGDLAPLFHISTTSTSPLPLGSQYCVMLKDGSGTFLSEDCFDLGFTNDSDTLDDTAAFSLVVPYPAGLHQVDLIQQPGGTVLSTRVASALSPTVTVTFPNNVGIHPLNGIQTITWTRSDLDTDPLTYDVLYSPDNGTTWIGVGADITETSYAVDFSSLPGTQGITGLIKVMASDGFNTTEDTSDNPFSVGNKPPTATILSPSSGASFTTGSQIALEGSGDDLQDGSLSGSALSWVSSKDGPLGTGQLLEVNLSPGVHTISLTVTDSNGLNDTDSIQVTVVQSISEWHLFLPLIIR